MFCAIAGLLLLPVGPASSYQSANVCNTYAVVNSTVPSGVILTSEILLSSHPYVFTYAWNQSWNTPQSDALYTTNGEEESGNGIVWHVYNGWSFSVNMVGSVSVTYGC